MMLVIDRFEGSFAVCEKEDRTMVNIPKDQIIGDPKEGDVIVTSENMYHIDQEETEKRREEIENLIKNMWK